MSINRRKILKYAAFTAPFIAFNSCSPLQVTDTPPRSSTTQLPKSGLRKPNILYIMSDDHAAHGIGSYGGRFANLNPTPNLDKFAQSGTVFTNTYVTNSICAPSRATILTGQYSQANGALDLEGRLPTERQDFVHAIKAAGYHTAIIGKWHLKEEPGAFDHYEVLERQGKYFDPEFFVRGPKGWQENINKTEGHSTDVITDKGIDWLKHNNTDKPFMLMLQYKAPHDMFEYAPRYESYLSDVQIPEPDDLYELKDSFGSVGTRGKNDALKSLIGTSVSKRNPRRNMGIHMDIDPSLPDREYTSQAYQKYVKSFLRCVKGIDDNIQRVFNTLKEEGLWEDTVVIYTADQGFMLGEHDMIDKRWMYDPSLKMPLIVRHPDLNGPAQADLILNNTDFAPFMLDIASAKIPSSMHGRSFLPVLSGETPTNWRDATYYRYWMHRAHHDVPAHFGIRTKEYKLIFFYGAFYDEAQIPNKKNARPRFRTPAAWELYDLKTDPSEQNNVYGQSEYAKITKKLKAELKRQRELYNETDISFPQLQQIIDAHWDN